MNCRHFLYLSLFPLAMLIVMPWTLIAFLLGCTAKAMRYPLSLLTQDGGVLERFHAWVEHDPA